MELEATHLESLEVLTFLSDFARSEYFHGYSSSGKIKVPPIMMDFAFPDIARAAPFLDTIIEDYRKNPSPQAVRAFMFVKPPEKEKESFGLNPRDVLLIRMNAQPYSIKFLVDPQFAEYASGYSFNEDAYQRWEAEVREELIKAVPALRE